MHLSHKIAMSISDVEDGAGLQTKFVSKPYICHIKRFLSIKRNF